ncbi:Arylsulfatase [Pirellulimonas nuda]|uniref:Arylsulfatase n=1 Tax=Pirellulimonas nuda TaxID=2528009 RepID=A0A518DI24_9BACT|nr:arylsulfatase [Pirellulimonas nuda]QDU91129.1 Arylsulfatase [Pirellulimonas nuda]
MNAVRSVLLRLTSLLVAWQTLASPAAADRPNVLVLLSDDQGWGDLSLSGNADLATPHVDSLAADGASFDRFYVCPVCSPTRAEFLTGRHHARSGVYATSTGGERLNLDETTIADLFRAAGYRTAAFGKWHNGAQHPYHPNARGFDEFFGFCSGHLGDYFDAMQEHNGRIVRGAGYCADDYTNHAITFIEQSVAQQQPFFVYVPYNTPHSPMQAPGRFWRRFADRQMTMPPDGDAKRQSKADETRCAYAMCENLDWNVGRLLNRLDAQGVAEDTIVVWFHDNGPAGVRYNDGMKGKKGQTDEGGVRSPLLVRWPGHIAPRTEVAHIASARDLLPTLCELAGVPAATRHPVDGLSLAPLLLGDTADWPDRVLINQWQDKISARSQQYRLDHQGKLYDMAADPGQTRPVNDAQPEALARLSASARAHRDAFMANYARDDRPFVVGDPHAPATLLPAADSRGHGAIRRSSRHPNSSYFTHWASPDDRITFNVEVATAGVYRVGLYYAAQEPGAKCELSFRDARLPFEITAAHDPPLRGAEHDRVPRIESYTKRFKQAALGEIELAQGPGELSLRALEIPGAEAMEFCMLTLERRE